MSKYFASLNVLLLAVFLVFSCETTPDPVEDPVDNVDTTIDSTANTNNTDGSATGPSFEPLTEEEILAVEALIVKAEEADALEYAPEDLENSKESLALAKSLNEEENYEEARLKLQAATTSANTAYNSSLTGLTDKYKNRLAEADAEAIEVQAPGFFPEDYASALALKDESLALFAEEQTTDGKVKGEQALAAYSSLIGKSQNTKSQVDSLQIEVENRLSAAEDEEAFIWAPEVLNQANQAYFDALRAYKEGNFAKTLELFTQSKYLAQLAIKASQDQMANKQTETLMLEVMRRIEEASSLTVVDEDDNIVLPDPWEGESFLDETLEEEPESAPEIEKTSALPLPFDGQAVVLGDVDRISALEKAKELWKLGVAEKNAGNYPIANEYFLESLQYLDIYEQQAVDKFYTVRLIPQRRDSLWRISEYQEIYGDPLAWPRIWRRNRKQVQNPDLIYPGWKLIIPPQ
jgi:nucleoid-associated protein YgaU